MNTDKYKTAPLKISKQEVLDQISKINERLEQSRCVHHGFLGGSLGLAYYYFNHYLMLKDQESLKKGRLLVEKVFEDFNDNNNHQLAGPFLSNGGAGFAFVINFLSYHKLIEFDLAKELKDLDEYLFETARDRITSDNIDYLHGAMGIIHYFSLTTQDSQRIEIVNRLLELLLQKMIFTSNGAFLRNSDLVNQKPSEVDLSLAHGLSGMLLIMLHAWELIKNKEKASKIIDAGVHYILSFRDKHSLKGNNYSVFPLRVDEISGETFSLNRLGWCYGDMNQVLLLYRAGRVLQNAKFSRIAEEVGIKTIKRILPQDTMATDAFFCHGSSGIASMYNTIYKETGFQSYYRQYIFWIKETLHRWQNEIKLPDGYEFNYAGLLEALAGSALVLTDYCSNRDTHWSKIFLL